MTVVQRINQYLKEHFPGYEAVMIIKKGDDVETRNLYMVAAQCTKGTYAVWEEWDNLFPKLENGHFGLKTREECIEIFDRYRATKKNQS